MKYFTIKELTYSKTAISKKIDNTPTFEAEENLEVLVDNLLDKIREKWGKPISVNSGYRCPQLNKDVGGAKTSQHMLGMAADITAGNKEQNKKLFKMIFDGHFDFDQLIDESNYSWLHISYNKGSNRGQVLHL